MDTSHDYSVQFHDACVAYDLSLNDRAFSDTVNALAKELAVSRDLRVQAGGRTQLWTDLRQVWEKTASASSQAQAQDDGSNTAVCESLAKFTANLVAEIPENQVCGFENESDIRRLLHFYTSWSMIKNPDFFTATRLLTQTLSNLVTANEALISTLWETYMTLPEDKVVVIRLLASPDPRTVFAVLVLILNCIHGSEERTTKLCTTKIGIRVCVLLLDKMVELYDAEESSDGARAFDMGYDIFTRTIEAGLVPDLFSKLTVDDEIITPSQITLLKLVDSYLQTNPQLTPERQAVGVTIMEQLNPMLSTSFLALSTYAQGAIHRALAPAHNKVKSNTARSKRVLSSTHCRQKPTNGEDQEMTGSAWFEESPDVSDAEESRKQSKPRRSLMISELEDLSRSFIPPTELDVLLPKVCEALVLIIQCIVTISAKMEDGMTSSGKTFQDIFNQSLSVDGQGLIESLVELLGLLDLFLPRINFGKPVVMQPSKTEGVANQGFSYLKRDLVRLLGILCYGVKAVQDRVRERGGIPIIMNLCVVDERNPYLREHAIFTLHNLLEGNKENQAVVEAMELNHSPLGDGGVVPT